MNYVVNGYQPKRVFEIFEELCAIPHGSGNEEAISNYILNFAKERGLECFRDAVNNVFARMPASNGYENAAPIMLQGHMDMVCEKNSDCKHDFLRDGLDLYVENGFLRARGTTLGGDDGIAVAMMLAILDGEIENHPEIECLFTVEEETGLLGANTFDFTGVHSRRMLNLDSEEEDVVTVGCAGGVRSDIVITGEKNVSGEAVKVLVKGLCGGHSGAEIHKGRANANKLAGRILTACREVTKLNIVEINGGSKDNAIPRECEFTVVCADKDAFIKRVGVEAEKICREVSRDDSEYICRIENAGVKLAFDDKTSTAAIAVIDGVPNGVLEMSKNIENLVEFSRNLGIVRTEGNDIHICFSTRSAIESQIDCSVSQLAILAELAGGKISHHARYPGWSYKRNSALRDDYLEAYESLYGGKPEVTVIHAGLECGIISSKVPDMDMISVGPNMRAIHSPDEALDLASCERMFKIVKKVIEKR